MKKVYEKPAIVFEIFSLSTAIAGSCRHRTEAFSNGTCGMDFSGVQVFLTDMNGCSDIKVGNEGGDGEFNGICYHVPTDGNNLFNS